MTTLIGGSGPSGPATAFSGLTVAGVPIVSSGGAPFFTGRWIFADYANGSDGNDGSADFPVQTLSQAYSLTTDGNNDVVVIVGDGSTAATQRLSSSLTWSNSATHLIGMTAPSMQAQRARISTLTTQTTNISPLMTVSGSGCYFANFSFFQGVGQASTDEKLIDITGSRNYFGNIHFGGMGAAAGAARAGSYVMYINGGGENLFQHCAIGLETIQRSAANASVKIAGGAQRNQFEDCIFPMNAGASSPLFLDASTANALNGSSMIFRRCLFTYLPNITGATQPAVVGTVSATVNGVVIFDQCTTNAAKWVAATTNAIVSGFPAGNGFSSGTFATAANV